MARERAWLRGAIALFLGLILASGAIGMGLAAPAALDCRHVVLTAPAAGATLSGPVEIQGRALVLNFKFYKVEYSLLGQDGWTLIGPDVVFQPVDSGSLVVWRTDTVPDGTYRLRLHVVDPTGNYCESILSPLVVSNAHPGDEPTPMPSETPVLTAVPPQPTPTSRVVVSTEIAPRPSTPALPTHSGPLPLAPSDLMVTAAFFLFGVCGMSGVVLSIATVMFVRKFGRQV